LNFEYTVQTRMPIAYVGYSCLSLTATDHWQLFKWSKKNKCI